MTQVSPSSVQDQPKQEELCVVTVPAGGIAPHGVSTIRLPADVASLVNGGVVLIYDEFPRRAQHRARPDECTSRIASIITHPRNPFRVVLDPRLAYELTVVREEGALKLEVCEKPSASPGAS